MSGQGRVVVLGGTGLIGRHVVEALRQAGHEDVRATYRSRPPFELPGVRWIRADLKELGAARVALQGADAAVLCAGRLSTSAELRRDPIGSVTDTLRIGVNTLEAAAQERTPRVVLLGSCTGFPPGADLNTEAAMFSGDPPAGWFGVGWMHRFLEKQLEWYSAHLGLVGRGLVLRPTLVYGPHDDFSRESGHFVPALIGQVVTREKQIEVWGDGKQTRNLIHAADVARAVLAGLESKTTYAAYNVATPKSVSVNEMLQALIEVDGFSDAEIVHRLDKSGGASALDVSAAAFAREFGWQPQFGLREGLAQTVAWYRKSLKPSG
jgi:nucleoside-diphosphate-sugar epimerase